MKDKIRLAIAGLLVWVVILAFIASVSAILSASMPARLIISIVSALVIIGLGFILFRYFKPSTLSFDEQILQLEREGLIQSESFRAKRAFQVEEREDEGSHYYLELEDGSVLFLTGQYLYDYEPIDDDPELNQPRRFPCTEFTVRWHRRKDYSIDILCGGQVIEPEVMAPPFNDFRDDRIPEDRQIITGRSYEQLKQERLERK